MIKNLHHYLTLDNQKVGNWHIFWSPFCIALVIRIAYHFLGVPDFWGDSYHTMYISWATIENDWVYSDYKGRHVVWLPFYRYLVTFFLFIFQSNDLLIPHILNMLIGSATCGLVAVLTKKLADHSTGIFAGSLLALSAWHMAYSHMNMPEVTALVLLVLAVYVWTDKKYIWLIPIGFAGVLTRNELTLLLGVFGAILLVKQSWRAAIYLFIGSVFGLGVWMWWNFEQKGEVFWWIESRSRGNAWDRYLTILSGGYVNHWYIHLIIFISVLPFIVFLFTNLRSYKKAIAKIPFKSSGPVLAVSVLVIFHWVFLLAMSTKYFSAPNGRFWLYSLPLACILFALITSLLKKETYNRIIYMSLGLSFGVLLFVSSILFQMRMVYAYNMEMGEYIGKSVPKNVNIWFDYPDILFFSEIDYSRAYSSDQIMPIKSRYLPQPEKDNFLISRMEELNIQYVISSAVSYSIVHSLWPQTKVWETFEWGPYRFIPDFTHDNTVDKAAFKPMRGWIRYFGGVNKSSVLWKIEKIQESPITN